MQAIAYVVRYNSPLHPGEPLENVFRFDDSEDSTDTYRSASITAVIAAQTYGKVELLVRHSDGAKTRDNVMVTMTSENFYMKGR